jgi:hypothetical protein
MRKSANILIIVYLYQSNTDLLVSHTFFSLHGPCAMHPILNLFLNTDIHKYLDEKFNQFQNSCFSHTVVMLHKLHLIKSLLSNTRRIASKKNVVETFVAVFLLFLQTQAKERIYKHWIAIKIINVGNKLRELF